MDLKIRKRPQILDLRRSADGHPLHIWRSGGIGDFVFMEPGLRKLKAQNPTRDLLLHAPAKYEALSKLIGFDGFEANETGVCRGPGLDFHWALERHPGWYCLDRVSIWEDLLGVPIGDEAVQLDIEKQGFPADKPVLAFLPFASNYGPRGRSIPLDHVVALIGALREQHAVMMLFAAGAPEEVKSTGVLCQENLSLVDFMGLLAGADKCLAVDTGGLYIAAAAGVPSVGLYSHVPPRLRIRRFPMIYGLDLRGPTCQCEQHGACSRPVRNECPCKYVAAETVLEALNETAYGVEVYNTNGTWINKLHVGVTMEPHALGTAAGRSTDFSLMHALAGIEWYYGFEGHVADYTLTVKAGDLIPRHVFLQALSDLEQPGYNQKALPIDLKRNRP
mgnify:CR=1 FL=1